MLPGCDRDRRRWQVHQPARRAMDTAARLCRFGRREQQSLSHHRDVAQHTGHRHRHRHRVDVGGPVQCAGHRDARNHDRSIACLTDHQRRHLHLALCAEAASIRLELFGLSRQLLHQNFRSPAASASSSRPTSRCWARKEHHLGLDRFDRYGVQHRQPVAAGITSNDVPISAIVNKFSITSTNNGAAGEYGIGSSIAPGILSGVFTAMAHCLFTSKTSPCIPLSRVKLQVVCRTRQILPGA